MMNVADFFPVWDRLPGPLQEKLRASAAARRAEKGAVLHRGGDDCTGLLLVRSGQLRVFALSEEGREITLYRLLERDICLFSAACMIQSIQFDLHITAEKDTSFWLIPADVYRALMQESAPLANFTNQIMASRFSDVMWLMDQVLWKRLDQRLAAFLLEESALEGETVLKTTHEAIANHLGTAREVVTRMLRYFQEENLIRLSRGAVELANLQGLAARAHASPERPRAESGPAKTE